MQSKSRGRILEGQLSAIPPSGTRIKPPSATMSPTKDVVDNVRHEEWHRREVVHAAFEASICGAEDEGRDAMLRCG